VLGVFKYQELAEGANQVADILLTGFVDWKNIMMTV
jgi:hypothetical protein